MQGIAPSPPLSAIARTFIADSYVRVELSFASYQSERFAMASGGVFAPGAVRGNAKLHAYHGNGRVTTLWSVGARDIVTNLLTSKAAILSRAPANSSR